MEDMEKIYEKYMPQVYRFLFSLCRDPHLTEELTQETFFQALKSIDHFRGDCKLYVWLCAIAKNLWYREMREKGEGVSFGFPGGAAGGGGGYGGFGHSEGSGVGTV